MKCNVKKYEIDKYISEHIADIENLLEQQGIHLLISGTGTSKTYTMLSSPSGVFRALSKKHKDRVFIIACPNRIQNQQNAKSYRVFALIGGERATINTNILTMVYEKSGEALSKFVREEGKEVTLIIDEAHQLIMAENYRGESIESIEELSRHCFNVIHLTATPRLLEDYYEYNNKYIFEYKDAKVNNNLGELFIHTVSDIDVSLIFKLKQINKEGLQSLVMIDSNDSIEKYKELLEKHKFKVGVLSREYKDNDVYDSVMNNDIIPSDYDIILATSLMECGTNIRNTNIVPIAVINRADYVSRDSLEQKFARLRNKNSYGIIFMKKYVNDDERSKIAIKDAIEKKLKFELERSVRTINNLIIFFKNEGYTEEDAVSLAKQNLNLTVGNASMGQGVIEIIDGVAIINKKKFIKKVYSNYDKQYVYNPGELVKYLEGHIKADKITLVQNLEQSDESTKDDLKEISLKNSELKEDAKASARNLVLKYRDVYLREYLDDKSLKDMFSPGAIRDFDFLEKEKTQLKILNKLVNKLQIDYDVAIKLYTENEKQADIDREVEKIIYLRNNRAIKLKKIDELDLKTEYGLIRRELDSICEKRGRLSDAKMFEIIDDLIQYKQYKKNKLYGDYKSEKDKTKKEKILKKIKEHFINRVSLIYNLSESGNQIRISSLKK